MYDEGLRQIIRASCLKAQKGRFAMQSLPPTASTSMPSPDDGNGGLRQTEDRTYKVFTVVSILLVLGSLWLF